MTQVLEAKVTELIEKSVAQEQRDERLREAAQQMTERLERAEANFHSQLAKLRAIQASALLDADDDAQTLLDRMDHWIAQHICAAVLDCCVVTAVSCGAAADHFIVVARQVETRAQQKARDKRLADVGEILRDQDSQVGTIERRFEYRGTMSMAQAEEANIQLQRVEDEAQARILGAEAAEQEGVKLAARVFARTRGELLGAVQRETAAGWLSVETAIAEAKEYRRDRSIHTGTQWRGMKSIAAEHKKTRLEQITERHQELLQRIRIETVRASNM